MSEKFRNRYRIKSSRAPWWNYGKDAAYYITICTKNRHHYFGEIHNNQMQFSSIGIIAELMWYEIKNHSKHCQLGQYVIMPNHVHGILILKGNGSLMNESPMNENSMVVDQTNVETRHALSLHLSDQPLVPLEQMDIQPIELSAIQTGESNQNDSNLGKISPIHPRFQNQGKNTISSIMGSYKSAVTKHAHRLGYEFSWQGRFHDHIFWDNEELETISNYIQSNVKNWDEDEFRIQ